LVPLKGGLPPGLTLGATGTISGTATVAGSSTFTIRIVDQAGHAAQKAFVLTVAGSPLSISTSSLPFAIRGAGYTGQLVASGGLPPYQWSVVAGTLPAGLALAAGTGLISGIPTGSGSFSFSIAVQDQASAPQLSSRQLQLLVLNPDQVPRISGLGYKPASGKLTVTGDNFDPNATLLIDGTTANIRSNDGNVILTKIPGLSAGPHQVVVVNPGGLASAPAVLTIN
jgi:hypothetical protein